MDEVDEVALDDEDALYLRGRERSVLVLGRTRAGRYLLLALHEDAADSAVAWVATARDMDDAERRRYRDG